MNYQHQQNTGSYVIPGTPHVAVLLTHLLFSITINPYVIQGNGQYVLSLYAVVILRLLHKEPYSKFVKLAVSITC